MRDRMKKPLCENETLTVVLILGSENARDGLISKRKLGRRFVREDKAINKDRFPKHTFWGRKVGQSTPRSYDLWQTYTHFAGIDVTRRTAVPDFLEQADGLC
jgi:hypothetical protein